MRRGSPAELEDDLGALQAPGGTGDVEPVAEAEGIAEVVEAFAELGLRGGRDDEVPLAAGSRQLAQATVTCDQGRQGGIPALDNAGEPEIAELAGACGRSHPMPERAQGRLFTLRYATRTIPGDDKGAWKPLLLVM